MFIKLTKLDGRPIWLNASFIVTVEPRKDGRGSVVVPIGDGLDYDVREATEDVLRMLDGAPVAPVVPIPVSDCLTKTPDDVSPEREERPPEPPPARPVQPPVAKQAEQKPAARSEEPSERLGENPAEAKKPRKRTTRTRKSAAAKAADAPTGETPKAEAPKAEEVKPEEAKPVAEPQPAPQPAKLELSDEEVARLRKLSPKSIAKLKNTLATQFQVADVGANVAALEARGVFAINGSRIEWSVPIADW